MVNGRCSLVLVLGWMIKGLSPPNCLWLSYHISLRQRLIIETPVALSSRDFSCWEHGHML